MKHELKAYLLDLIECCNNINDFLENLEVNDYLENRIVKSAVERQFEIIGTVLIIGGIP
jgi:uncharacterized protein with HEPN domain